MKIAVIGTGYVGLISGLGLAGAGHHVTCFDVDKIKIQCLQAGKPTIYEDGLSDELEKLVDSGHIQFKLISPDALSESDVILIAVGTPSKNGNIDLSYVKSAARVAAESLFLSKQPVSIVVKSTVIPGTTSEIVRNEINSVLSNSGRTYGLGMNPEFLREGSAILDFQQPDRVVIGYEDEIALMHLREMYQSFSCPKLEVNTKTAELIKYANNFLLALQISATNEISNLATAIGDIDPMTVMAGVLADRRWAGDWKLGDRPHGIASYLAPGPGFGGSCFPKDVEALMQLGNNIGVQQTLAKATLSVNSQQPQNVVSQLLGNNLKDTKVLVLGLAFKPNTDDVRETPSFGVVAALQEKGATVYAHDPLAVDNFKKEYSSKINPVEFVANWVETASTVDVIFVVTPWIDYLEAINSEFANLNILFADPRRAFDKNNLPSNFKYLSLGI